MTAGKTYFNWSGGKDSALALYQAQRSGEYKPDMLLTSVNQSFQRISMHGVRRELLEMQAEQIGLLLANHLPARGLTMTAYNAIMTAR
jgi:diphthamide synthase (EF-2-diphthine--ammonia ligase)